VKTARGIIAGTVIAIVSSSWGGCERRAIVETRVQDVKQLLMLHSEHRFTNTEISQLLVLAEQKGIKISSPIAKNPAMPSYRIVTNAANADFWSSVIIEETSNVEDPKKIVRGYLDGHVSVELKN
jgi:hypothetical protein